MANKLIRKGVVWGYDEDWKLILNRHRSNSYGYRKVSSRLIKLVKRHGELEKFNNEQ